MYSLFFSLFLSICTADLFFPFTPFVIHCASNRMAVVDCSRPGISRDNDASPWVIVVYVWVNTHTHTKKRKTANNNSNNNNKKKQGKNCKSLFFSSCFLFYFMVYHMPALLLLFFFLGFFFFFCSISFLRSLQQQRLSYSCAFYYNPFAYLSTFATFSFFFSLFPLPTTARCVSATSFRISLNVFFFKLLSFSLGWRHLGLKRTRLFFVVVVVVVVFA